MHTSHTPMFRKVAAGSAVALAATGAAFIASPAQAATSAPLNYTCNSPALGDFTVQAAHTTADTVQYGGTAALTTEMTLPPEVVGGLNFFEIDEVAGTAKNHALASVPLGSLPVTAEQVIDRTAVPASGTMTLVAEGGVSTAQYAGATPVGTVIDVDMYDRQDADAAKAYDIEALLTIYKDGEPGGPVPVNCELVDGQDLNVGGVEVVQAITETTAKLSYAAKAGKVVSKAIVDAPASGASVVGQVKFVLKRNGEKIASSVEELNTNQVASFKTSAPKKGNYKLVTKYLGDSNFVASQDSITKSF